MEIDVAFEYVLYHLPFSLCMESTPYVFPFRMVFFYLVTTGWIFDFSLYVGIQSINKKKGVWFFRIDNRVSS